MDHKELFRIVKRRLLNRCKTLGFVAINSSAYRIQGEIKCIVGLDKYPQSDLSFFPSYRQDTVQIGLSCTVYLYSSELELATGQGHPASELGASQLEFALQQIAGRGNAARTEAWNYFVALDTMERSLSELERDLEEGLSRISIVSTTSKLVDVYARSSSQFRRGGLETIWAVCAYLGIIDPSTSPFLDYANARGRRDHPVDLAWSAYLAANAPPCKDVDSLLKPLESPA